MKNARTLLSAFCVAATAAVLTACGAVGEGNRPVSAAIQPSGEAAGVASTKAYVCLPKQLDFILTFNNGEKGSYFNATKWSSSNPAVAEVSNADIPLPGTSFFYNRGVVVSRAAGTATITAEYLTFKKSIDVTVDSIGNLRTLPSELNLAPGSLADLAVVGELGGVTTSLDANATWAFVTPNTATANIDPASGLVAAVAEGPALTARASLIGCDSVADATVNVSPLQSLALSQEFAGNANLVVGTTERLTATGTLANGKTQDLSLQSSYASGDATSLAPLTGSLYGYVFAAKASAAPVSVTASFGSPAVTSDAVNITPIDATLTQVTLAPATAALKPGGAVGFVATGEYASGSQPITRHVAFTSNDTATAVVATSGSAINPLAGLALAPSTATVGKTATITATSTTASVAPATATVTIVSATP